MELLIWNRKTMTHSLTVSSSSFDTNRYSQTTLPLFGTSIKHLCVSSVLIALFLPWRNHRYKTGISVSICLLNLTSLIAYAGKGKCFPNAVVHSAGVPLQECWLVWQGRPYLYVLPFFCKATFTCLLRLIILLVLIRRSLAWLLAPVTMRSSMDFLSPSATTSTCHQHLRISCIRKQCNLCKSLQNMCR